MSVYDFVFVLDYNSLLTGKFFSIYDIENSKIRISTAEMKKLNKVIIEIKDDELKKNYIDIVSQINVLADEQKIFFLGEEEEEFIEYKLLEVLVKNFYLRNVLIISNDKTKIEKYLPLTAIYQGFSKQFDIGYISDCLNFYEYNEKEAALNCIAVSEGSFEFEGGNNNE